MTATALTPLAERTMPRVVRWLGGRYRNLRSFRMKWGELSFGEPGWALALLLFGDPDRFTLHVQVWRVFDAYIHLPFMRRFAREPEELMEMWGVSYAAFEGALFLRWGARCRILSVPWRDWVHVRHEVMRPDGTWVPAVSTWETEKVPDGRLYETHPYHYLLRSGEVQERTATICVERRVWRLRWLRWTSRFERVRTYLDVEFSGEVGERTGSWKGGTVGCSYEMRPGETPHACLQRMSEERRFS